MAKKDFHLCFRDMEKRILGRQVIELLDVTEKKTVFIYEILASVIKDLGICDLSGKEIAKEVDIWIAKTLYGYENVRSGDGVDRATRTKDGRAEDEKSDNVASSGHVSGKYDMSSFMGNSKFSNITGGEG